MQNNKNILQTTSPAQLWIGQHDHLVKQAKKTLQTLFCENNGCKTCKTCELVENKQHHGAIWIEPEKYYTRDEIQVIFNTISFKLEENQKLFFVIQHADFLTPACSNSLLKSVEEPPPGYNFLFLAERQSQILLTIQSRCIIKSFYENNHDGPTKQIVDIFKTKKPCSPDMFLKILDEEKPNEKETIEYIDMLLRHWLKISKSAIEDNNQKKYSQSMTKIEKLKKALQSPPMPGSSKIFWRNLYLQMG